MNNWELLIVSMIYAKVGLTYSWQAEWAWAVFWFGYSISNIAYMLAKP